MLVCVSSIKSYRDEFGTCKWHYLVRYFLGPRVAKGGDALGADLVEVLNCYLSRGYLAKSRQHGVISQTFKKGDRLDPP